MAKKVAYIMAALFHDRLTVDAAEMIASRIEEIYSAVIAAIRSHCAGRRLERQDVKDALPQRSRMNE